MKCKNSSGAFAIAHTLFEAINLFWINITQIQKSIRFYLNTLKDLVTHKSSTKTSIL